jgi:hypothetical protein
VAAVCIVAYLFRSHQLSVEAQQAEIKRRLAVCDEIRHAIGRYNRDYSDFLARHEATVAVDRAEGSDIGENRALTLRKYWFDVDICQTGIATMRGRSLRPVEQTACNQTGDDAIAAIKACSEGDLDFDLGRSTEHR